jgi:membrane-associated phospholipid phosphatase
VRRLTALFVFISISASVFAKDFSPENDSAKHEPFLLFRDSVLSFRSEKGLVPSFFINMQEQFLAPFKMNLKQFAEFGAGTLITYGLIKNDAAIDENYFRYLKPKSELVEEVSPRITMLGESYAGYFLIGYAGYSFIGKDYKAWRTSLLATEACLSAGLWVRLGKMMTSRERPSVSYWTGVEGGQWRGFVSPFSDLYKSRSVSTFDAFPSGHTSAAFSIATVFAMQYSDKKAIPPVAYTVASLVGISRLTEHEHWVSDIFVGGIIGYLCGRQVVLYDRKVFARSAPEALEGSTHSQSRKKKAEWSFAPAGNGLGLVASW